MINIFDRYIIRHVLGSTLLVMSVMLGLIFLTTLLGEVQDVGRGDYTFVQAIIYVILRLPHNIYQFSPMLIMLGGIIGLGMLNTHHELMIIRSSGFSVRRLLKAMTYSALLLVAITMLLGEGLAPQLDHKAAMRKQNAKNNGQAVITGSGVWLHEGNDFYHIDRIIGRKHLEGVIRYQFDSNHQLVATYHAATMDFQNGTWELSDVDKTEFIPQAGTQSSYKLHDTWSFTLNPNLLNIGMIEPEEMSLVKLFSFSHHLVANGLQASQFKLAFWQRLLQPFAIILMLLLAVPFILSAPRSTMLGLRIVLGIIVGFIFYLCNAFIGQISIIYQFPPFLAAMVPILLFAGIGYWRICKS
jgi:lipopolysaccharide export system permease protein